MVREIERKLYQKHSPLHVGEKTVDEFSFEWHEARALSKELSMPVIRASIEECSKDMVFGISLWHQDGTALTICSKMHDLYDREEVGVLSFKVEAHPSTDKWLIDLPDYFSEIIGVKKLKVYESCGVIAESGVVLEMNGGHELTIVAGNFPCSIAIAGLPNIKLPFHSEWPISKYEKQILK